jgi:hypothetical protein
MQSTSKVWKLVGHMVSNTCNVAAYVGEIRAYVHKGTTVRTHKLRDTKHVRFNLSSGQIRG